jgi:phenylalanyl-tRNA synthetase beta chain
MHAFDLDRLEGGIVVRTAEAGEEIALLNDQTVTLGEDNLVIADHRGAVALAGIMGGAASAVGTATRNILLEAAFFAPEPLNGKARALGLHTDSSHRFERGVDYRLQRRAMERATQLLLDIVGGTPGPVVEAVDEGALPAAAARIPAPRAHRAPARA